MTYLSGETPQVGDVITHELGYFDSDACVVSIGADGDGRVRIINAGLSAVQIQVHLPWCALVHRAHDNVSPWALPDRGYTERLPGGGWCGHLHETPELSTACVDAILARRARGAQHRLT